jgi:hypothetical protein
MSASLAALALGLLAALILVLPAAAGRTWCYADPIVLLDGATLQVEVAIPTEYQPAVNDAIVVTIATPAGVSRETIFTDAGFNGLGEVVIYRDSDDEVAADGSFPVRVTVEVPVDRSQLRSLELSPRVPVQALVTTGGATTVAEGDNGRARVDVTVSPGAP